VTRGLLIGWPGKGILRLRQTYSPGGAESLHPPSCRIARQPPSSSTPSDGCRVADTSREMAVLIATGGLATCLAAAEPRLAPAGRQTRPGRRTITIDLDGASCRLVSNWRSRLDAMEGRLARTDHQGGTPSGQPQENRSGAIARYLPWPANRMTTRHVSQAEDVMGVRQLRPVSRALRVAGSFEWWSVSRSRTRSCRFPCYLAFRWFI